MTRIMVTKTTFKKKFPDVKVQKLQTSGGSLAAVGFDGLRKRLLLPCYVPADLISHFQ